MFKLPSAMIVCSVVLLATVPSTSRGAPDVPASITTPDRVETRIGTLEFRDGVPTPETIDKAFDNLDFTYA